MRPQLFPKSRLKRSGTAAVIAVAATLCLSVLGSSPAFAESTNPLPGGGGHTCKQLADDGFNTTVICLDLGLYTTSSGAQFITAQVEFLCSIDGGDPTECFSGAAKATVANGAGYTDWTVKGCNTVPCQASSVTGRSYLFPFGGLSIGPGICDANVWASVEGTQSMSPTFLTPFDNLTQQLRSNFATPHFNVCETSTGQIKYTAV